MPRPKLLVLNGPNLGILGRREPGVYGRLTLSELNARVEAQADLLGFDCDFRQHDGEGELVAALNHADEEGFVGIIFNPGAYTHYSIALLDAVAACAAPVIEVHLSNIFAREPFRRRSVTAKAATGFIAGLGANAYELAVQAIARLLSEESTTHKSTTHDKSTTHA